LIVLEGDITEFKEDFTKDMEVMDKMKHFCLHVNDAAAAGAGIANNHEECMQDILSMNRMIMSLAFERVFMRQQRKHSLPCLYHAWERKWQRTAVPFRWKGQQAYILVPTHRPLVCRALRHD
jgi:hypothetical protein